MSLGITLHLVSLVYMTGVIWQVQLNTYPLFAYVQANAFGTYHERHTKAMGKVVGLPMLIEFTTGIFFFLHYFDLFPYRTLIVTSLLIFIWLSTFSLQVPLHSKLSRGYDKQAIELLQNTNWIRTLSWSFRTLLILSMVIST